MTLAELLTVGLAVLVALVVAYRQFAQVPGEGGGRCKGCGDSCGCVIKDHKANKSSEDQIE